MPGTARKTTANRTPEEKEAIRRTRQANAENLNRKRLLKTAEDACKTARQSLESGDVAAHDQWVGVAQSTLASYVKTVAANSDGATLGGVNKVRTD